MLMPFCQVRRHLPQAIVWLQAAPCGKSAGLLASPVGNPHDHDHVLICLPRALLERCIAATGVHRCTTGVSSGSCCSTGHGLLQRLRCGMRVCGNINTYCILSSRPTLLQVVQAISSTSWYAGSGPARPLLRVLLLRPAQQLQALWDRGGLLPAAAGLSSPLTRARLLYSEHMQLRALAAVLQPLQHAWRRPGARLLLRCLRQVGPHCHCLHCLHLHMHGAR